MAAGYTGDPLEIGFNAEYLRDGVESIAGDDFRLQVDQSAPPRPAGRLKSGDFWYLIMPIRLAG